MDIARESRKGLWRRMLFFGLLNIAVVVPILFLTDGEGIVIIPFLLLYSCTMPFISLLFSKYLAKKTYRMELIDEGYTYEPQIEWYRNTTYRIARKAGLRVMPELAVYASADKNAFATGRSKNSSLIAVSSALLYDMSDDAVEAVIAHEIAHIVNGDMVTQTLLQSFINIIVSAIILPITIYRWLILFLITDRDTVWFYWLLWIFETIVSFVLLFFAGLITKKHSRTREFGADYLASQLTHPSKMVQALRELDGSAVIAPEHKRYAALQFNGQSRFMDMFSTHPSIERRIDYLHKQFRNSNPYNASRGEGSSMFDRKTVEILLIVGLIGIIVWQADKNNFSFSNLFESGKENIGNVISGEGTGEFSAYILPFSASEYVTDSELSRLSKSELRLARNEIYARHGFIFESAELTNHFKKQSWYEPNPNFSDSMLSKLEHTNVARIQKFERAAAPAQVQQPSKAAVSSSNGQAQNIANNLPGTMQTVVSERGNLRAAPSLSAQLVIALPRGTDIYILRTKVESADRIWCEVELTHNGVYYTGWLSYNTMNYSIK